MPGTVKVKVLSARNLPIMDRATYLTDAFVEICIGNITYKTDVVRRSLSPWWNSEWFCFELDDQSLQEEALLLKVMDHDTYSTHDPIGRVYFDLNPLISRGQTRSLNGWFPIYDTMHGIRGEINLAIRVDVFLDANRYHQSSVGVKFFHCCGLPNGYSVDLLIGFVQELVMNDDPEHQWIERIRTSRASNEARQRLFSRLSGELQRKLGLKVLNLGGNSVIGYQLHFDLEGETGVVVRGIGTAVRLKKHRMHGSPTNSPVPVSESPMELADPTGFSEWEPQGRGSTGSNALQSALKLGEFPFLTISQPIPGTIRHFGGVVASKSVNLLDKNTPAGIQFRDAWWLELRTEVTQHMHSMHCNAVLGYREECTIYEDVCVLSNYGTAVVLDFSFLQAYNHSMESSRRVLSHSIWDTEYSSQHSFISTIPAHSIEQISSSDNASSGIEVGRSPTDPKLLAQRTTNGSRLIGAKHGTSARDKIPRLLLKSDCTICHVPPSSDSSPKKHIFSIPATVCCATCQAAHVPDLLLASVDFPPELMVTGKPALIQARTCRSKKDQKGEAAANEISEMLPFVEYELHYRLLQKLRLLGMNAIFGLKFHFSIGESFVAAIATGTAVFVSALPSPPPPKISPIQQASSGSGDLAFRKSLQIEVNNYIRRCHQTFGLGHEIGDALPADGILSRSEKIPAPTGNLSSHRPVSKLDKVDQIHHDTAFLETREPEPEELAVLLQDPLQPSGLVLLTTESFPASQPDSDEQPSPNDGSTCDQTNNANYTAIDHLWTPIFGFARVHQEKLTSPDSFVETTGFASALLSDPAKHANKSEVHHTARGSLLATGVKMTTDTANQSMEEMGPLINSSGLTHPRQQSPSRLHPNRRLGDILNECNQLAWYRFRSFLPCALVALDYHLAITEDDCAQVVTTGMLCAPTRRSICLSQSESDAPLSASPCKDTLTSQSTLQLSPQEASSNEFPGTELEAADLLSSCLLTPLASVPNTVVDAYLGNLDFFFIRETNDLRDAGGVCGFLHTSLTEVQAVVGAHTSSLGGNALLSYHLSELVVLRPASRNQAQCLLNVCGDMAKLSRINPSG